MRRASTQKAQSPERTEVKILTRLFLNGDRGIDPRLARHIVELRFDDDDKSRMNELAAKNQEGAISRGELQELDSYIRVGDLLAILKLKARKILKGKAN